MIRAGTTCFIDPGSYFPEQTWKALEQSGMRGVLARTAVDIGDTPIGKMPDDWALEPTDQAIAKAIETVEKFNGTLDGRAKGWFSLRLLSACSDKLIKEIKRLSDEKGVGLVMHACQSAMRWSAHASNTAYLNLSGWPIWAAAGRTRAHPYGLGKPQGNRVVHGTRHENCLLTLDRLPAAFGSIEVGRFPEMLELGITVCSRFGRGRCRATILILSVKCLWSAADASRNALSNHYGSGSGSGNGHHQREPKRLFGKMKSARSEVGRKPTWQFSTRAVLSGGPCSIRSPILFILPGGCLHRDLQWRCADGKWRSAVAR